MLEMLQVFVTAAMLSRHDKNVRKMGLVIGHKDQHPNIRSLFVYRVHCSKLVLPINFCRFKFLH